MEPLDPAQPMQDNSGILGTGTDRHSAFADSTQIGSPIPDSSGQESLPILGPELVSVDATEVLSGFPVLKNGGEFSSLVAAGANTPQGIDPLTGSPLVTTADLPSLSLPSISTETLLSEAKTQATTLLSQLIDTPALLADLHEAFGESWNPSDAEALVKDLAGGNGWPSLVVLEGAVLNANGAFSQETNTIYLSQEFLSRNVDNPKAITSVLLEEVGHYIDSKLNTKDSPGDEGAIFSAIVRGISVDRNTLSAIRIEDDSAYILVDGQVHFVEQASSSEPLMFGNTINGSISVPGDQNQYTFNLSDPSKIYIDVLSYENSTNWSLTDSSGSLIDGGSLGFYGYTFQPALNLEAGNYILKINLESNFTGNYSIRVLDLANATPITLDTTLNDILSENGQINFYQFQGLTGDRLHVDLQSLNINDSLQWRLIGPYGGEFYPWELSRLPQTGIYTLLVEGYFYDRNSSSYTLNLSTIPEPPSEPLTLNAIVNGSIDTTKSYTFNLSTDSKFYFDSLTSYSNFTWTLTGSDGTVINNRSLFYSDRDNYQPLLNLASGDYMLTIDAPGTVTGAYSFRLLDLAQATVITPGTPVSGTLDPANETDLYQFNVNAGEKFFFDAQSVNGTNYNSNWRLLDPNGNIVFQTSLGATYYWWWGQRAQDVDTLTLSQSGTYTLMVEGYNGDSGSGSYTFNVQPVINQTPEPLIVGNTINGSIDTTGSQKQYTFNLTSDSRFYFDSLTPGDNRFTWTLTGANNGTVINSQQLPYSDINNYSPILNLKSGDYTLTIDASGDATGAFAFRLMDLANATVITPGTPVNGAIDQVGETDLYQFQAQAGDKFC
jgi:hypothetical protein